MSGWDWVLIVIGGIAGILGIIFSAPILWAVAVICLLMELGLIFIRWLAPVPFACKLVTNNVLPDECRGNCPPGSQCVVVTTRPYGPWGMFGTQAASCACVAIAPGGGGVPVGGGAGSSGGSSGSSSSSGAVPGG